MGFLVVQPEVAGASVTSPPPTVACRFDTWLGDDLVLVHPLFLVTTPLRRALSSIHNASGYSIVRARVTTSPFFRRYSPNRRLPLFWYLRADGVPGRDDVAVTRDGSLVVSRRVLDVFMEFRVGRAVFAQYTPHQRLAAQQATNAESLDGAVITWSPKAHQITPFLHVPDLERALQLFVGVLAFRVVYREGNYAYLEFGGAGLRILEERGRRLCPDGKARMTVYVDVPDVDALYTQLLPRLKLLPASDVEPPLDKSWNQREFQVPLPDGDWLTFGQPVRGQSQ